MNLSTILDNNQTTTKKPQIIKAPKNIISSFSLKNKMKLTRNQITFTESTQNTMPDKTKEITFVDKSGQ
jgi:hypothetical protein